MSDKTAPIILLEDDALLRDMLADGLSHDGYTVVPAATRAVAREALAAADGNAVLVADRSVDRDGPNGFHLAAEALAHYPALRVVYISGTHIAIRQRKLGTRERALLKPFALSQLLTALDALAR